MGISLLLVFIDHLCFHIKQIVMHVIAEIDVTEESMSSSQESAQTTSVTPSSDNELTADDCHRLAGEVSNLESQPIAREAKFKKLAQLQATRIEQLTLRQQQQANRRASERQKQNQTINKLLAAVQRLEAARRTEARVPSELQSTRAQLVKALRRAQLAESEAERALEERAQANQKIDQLHRQLANISDELSRASKRTADIEKVEAQRDRLLTGVANLEAKLDRTQSLLDAERKHADTLSDDSMKLLKWENRQLRNRVADLELDQVGAQGEESQITEMELAEILYAQNAFKHEGVSRTSAAIIHRAKEKLGY